MGLFDKKAEKVVEEAAVAEDVKVVKKAKKADPVQLDVDQPDPNRAMSWFKQNA